MKSTREWAVNRTRRSWVNISPVRYCNSHFELLQNKYRGEWRFQKKIDNKMILNVLFWWINQVFQFYGHRSDTGAYKNLCLDILRCDLRTPYLGGPCLYSGGTRFLASHDFRFHVGLIHNLKNLLTTIPWMFPFWRFFYYYGYQVLNSRLFA